MAKGTGLIGNFKGKVGNMVGYNLKDSNNKQTQGIRVYQPVVRNPKSYAQAQQRCIMKPINDFYRALKPVISRGQEGKAYGNASRLAWLKNVMKDFNGPWLVKGDNTLLPIECNLTNGQLLTPGYYMGDEKISLNINNLQAGTSIATIGALSTILLTDSAHFKSGDQVTITVMGASEAGSMVDIKSFVIDTADSTPVSNITAVAGAIEFGAAFFNVGVTVAGAIIVSREGANGEHLRTTSSFEVLADWKEVKPYDDAAKAAAIASYMTAGANTDWPQEALEG